MPKQLPSNRVKEIADELKGKPLDYYCGLTTIKAILQYLDEREAEDNEDWQDDLAKQMSGTPVTPSKDEGNKIAHYRLRLKQGDFNCGDILYCPDHFPKPKDEDDREPRCEVIDSFYNEQQKKWIKRKCGWSIPCPDHPPQPKPRWKPHQGDCYYCVDSDGGVWKDHWEGLFTDENTFDFYNVFSSREKAEQAAQAIRDLLMRIQGE